MDQYDLVPLDFEFIKPYEEIEWENDTDTKHFEDLMKEALHREKVILDDFYIYKNE